jgi:hypothetical protein
MFGRGNSEYNIEHTPNEIWSNCTYLSQIALGFKKGNSRTALG